MKNIIKSILAAFALSGISACSTLPTYISYEGARLPSDKEATVTGTHDTTHKVLAGLNENVMLLCSNGKSTEAPWYTTAKFKYPFEAAVKPGRNHIGVLWGHFRTFAVGSLWFDAIAGHAYKVAHKVDGDRVIFTILDLTENKVVDGPSATEPNKSTGSRNCDEIANTVKERLSEPTTIYVYIYR